RDQYIRSGYSYCDVRLGIQSSEELREVLTTVMVTIEEGERVRIGQIGIVGLMKTDPKVIRRELTFQSGDWYNPEDLSESRTRLMNLGIFRSVQISPADRIAYLDKENVLDLVVEIYEGSAGNVSFGPGYNL